jgi:hypothetical protein
VANSRSGRLSKSASGFALAHAMYLRAMMPVFEGAAACLPPSDEPPMDCHAHEQHPEEGSRRAARLAVDDEVDSHCCQEDEPDHEHHHCNHPLL